ncbi:DUF3841 domain-containing protein [uncultured Brevibacillus sp.]|uniref:DUF3841 domain-containing protein n=1 Tax=uncultured Brevibacillus sp. TaxID=169970 RepID=UPI00259712E3|nr:DUF3841 domain-containing protein [uncultured Brevibacillus sp.]
MSIFWTMQTDEAWKQYEKQGYLEGTPEHAMYSEEYQWIIKQMKQRLPNYRGEYPIWLWIKKPDMRSTGHFEGGTKCVRLTLEIDPKNVLVSDFDDWHCVLNNTFCADKEQEWEAHYEGNLEITKEESWHRIFDIDRHRDPEWHGEGKRRLQGTTGRMELSCVKKVEHFIARKSFVESMFK